MKKTYVSPSLVNYGSLSQLTLGSNAFDCDNNTGLNTQNRGQDAEQNRPCPVNGTGS